MGPKKIVFSYENLEENNCAWMGVWYWRQEMAIRAVYSCRWVQGAGVAGYEFPEAPVLGAPLLCWGQEQTGHLDRMAIPGGQGTANCCGPVAGSRFRFRPLGGHRLSWHLYIVFLRSSFRSSFLVRYRLTGSRDSSFGKMIGLKAVPVTGRGGPYGSEMLRIPHCTDNRLTHGAEVVSPRTSRALLTTASGTRFC
jgi:hypothetical protein